MNDIQTVTQNVRLQQRTAIIQYRQVSGLKVDDYCSEHNISRNTYYYWLRKVSATAIENSGSLFAEVKPSFFSAEERRIGSTLRSMRAMVSCFSTKGFQMKNSAGLGTNPK